MIYALQILREEYFFYLVCSTPARSKCSPLLSRKSMAISVQDWPLPYRPSKKGDLEMIEELQESIHSEELFLEALRAGDKELIAMLSVDVATAIQQSQQRINSFTSQIGYLQKNNVQVEEAFDLPWIQEAVTHA
jgi:hypothetical protein